jgi:hypothetical protein
MLADLTSLETPGARARPVMPDAIGPPGRHRAARRQDRIHHGAGAQSDRRTAPAFTPDAEGRIIRAYLEPQPDDSVPPSTMKPSTS